MNPLFQTKYIELDNAVVKDFISIGPISKIWNGENLEKFTRVALKLNLKKEQIVFLRQYMIRTFALLVYISHRYGRDMISRWDIPAQIRIQRKWDDDLLTLEDDILIQQLTWMTEEDKTALFVHREKFTAPILRDGHDLTIRDGQHLPFDGRATRLGQGHSGVVTGHRVALGHLKLRRQSAIRHVAKKKLTYDYKADEKRMLQELRDWVWERGRVDDIRIETILSIIKKDYEYFGLSLCAKATLAEFLKSPPPVRYATMERVTEEVKGLSEALTFLHKWKSVGPAETDTFCIHLDLKPENILLFDYDIDRYGAGGIGKWKMTDFGVAQVRRVRQRWTEGGPREDGDYRPTYTVYATAPVLPARYQPPEVEFAEASRKGMDIQDTSKFSYNESKSQSRNKKIVGRGSDVWSLGCIFADVLDASLNRKVHEKAARSGHYYEKRRLSVLRGLRRSRQLDEWLGGLLEVEQTECKPALKLCKSLLEDMLRVKRIQRIKSSSLALRIDDILAEVQKLLQAEESRSSMNPGL